MAEPKISQGTLLIQRAKDKISGQWSPYVKIGISRSLPPRDIIRGSPEYILTIYTIKSPMIENLSKQLMSTFSHCRTKGQMFLINDQSVISDIIPEAERIATSQNKSLSNFQSKVLLKTEESSGHIRKPTHKELALYSQIIDAKLDLDVKIANQEIIKGRLFDEIRNSSDIPGVLKLTSSVRKRCLQKARLKEDYRAIYLQYESEKSSKISGTVKIKGAPSIRKVYPMLYNTVTETKEKSQFDIQQLNNPSSDRTTSTINIHFTYLDNLADIAKAEWLYESLIAKLAARVGLDDGIEGLISWKRKNTKKLIFDEDSFKKNHPEIYSEYLQPEKTIVTSRISPYGIYEYK
jgi:hypothetical protein